MNSTDKKMFILSHLNLANENIIDEFYEKIHNEEMMIEKLEKREIEADKDTKKGKFHLSYKTV